MRDTLYYISRIGNFEARILWRSWLFRVFSLLILTILFLFDLFAVLGLAGGGTWTGRYIPGNIVYFNFFVFTVAQVIIASFLSADFLGRERKMDTTEVFYTRPVSNLGYVLGKTWGALMLFSGLNFVVLLLAMLITLLSPDAPFALAPFFFHFFVYSLPALLFILGFSFMLMVLIRNQAVTFVLVLGFGAIVLFYLQNKHWGLWDFIGFYLPAQYSGFTGFSNLPEILRQRAVFVLLGLLGIFMTAFSLPRLPGTKNKSAHLLLLSALALVGAGLLIFHTVSSGMKDQNLRKDIRQQEGLLPLGPQSRIDSCHINIHHENDELFAEAFLKMVHHPEKDSILLALNPGFVVQEVLINDNPAAFTHHLGLLSVAAYDQTIQRDSLLLCRIKYRGAPDQQAIFPYVSEEDRQLLNRHDPLVAGKEYAFIQSGFLLLTREAGWYPVVAWRYYRQQAAFTAYSLRFTSHNNLAVFSQGAARHEEEATLFVNDQALNALTLLSGNYAVDSIRVDGVDYQLGVQADNVVIRENFDQIRDTLPTLIRDLKGLYERNLKLEYPFKRLKIVEVPTHFYTYLQHWTTATDHIQPEFILLPEYGGGQWAFDVNRIRNDFEADAKQQGEDPDQKEIQARMFVTLVGNALVFSNTRIIRNGQDIKTNLEGWSRIQIFPLYFHHAYQIQEEGWPVFQIMLEEALRNKSQRGSVNRWRLNQDQYMGLLALKKHSLSQWMTREAVEDTLVRILHLRGIQFFKEISALSQTGEFTQELERSLMNRKFRASRPSLWLRHLELPFDAYGKYHSIQEGDQLPAYEFGWARTWEVSGGDKNKYWVSLDVSNVGGADGVLQIQTTFLDVSQGQNQSYSQWMYQNVQGDNNEDIKLHLIPGSTKVRIDMLFDQLPRHMTILTGVAQNIPPVKTYYLSNFNATNGPLPEEGVHPIDSAKATTGPQNEILVDNEDPGFSIASMEKVRTLKDWLIQRERGRTKEYEYFESRNPKAVWTRSLGENYHGGFLQSAVLKAAGKGADLAAWQAYLPEEGIYEVQVFIPNNLDVFWRQRNSKGAFHYNVVHANGVEEVASPPVRERSGWISLGRYFFNEGEAVVELLDKTDFPYVVADAVKWVKTN